MMQGGGHLALYDNHDALRRENPRQSKPMPKLRSLLARM